ncbi:MAG: hypothetical protein J6B01_09445 [Ruminococcus sp.]|nr:hypothetical protein [Ruminococcus sp.]
MDQEKKLSEENYVRLKCFDDGFAAALSTQEILDKARLDELVNMLSMHFCINTNENVDEKLIRVVCKKAYKERRNHIRFYIDTLYRDENEEMQFMQLVRDTVPGADIAPLVRTGMYAIGKKPYLTEADLHAIAGKLIEVFPQHAFFVDRMRINQYTKAKIGEFRISYDTRKTEVYNEEFIW